MITLLVSMAFAGPLGPATVGNPPPVSMNCSDVRRNCQQPWTHEGLMGEHWAMLCPDGTVGQVGFSAWWAVEAMPSADRHVNLIQDPLQAAFAMLRAERLRRESRGWNQIEEGVTMAEAAVIMKRSLSQLTMAAWDYPLLEEADGVATLKVKVATLVMHTAPRCSEP